MITVLLATYNGSAYLRELLDSLIAQNAEDFRIVARDDGSHDSTLSVLEQYRKMYPDIIEICPDTVATGSAQANFFRMLELYRDDYIMLCDQDDYWKPEKIRLTLNAMQQAEKKYGNIPLLVHTDLTVVNSSLDEISPSFMAFQKLSPEKNEFNNYLLQNNVTGCTVMINRALQEKLYSFPKICPMHDGWLALIAAAFGKIVYLNESTILYRQHSGNQVGAKNAGSLSFLMNRLGNIGTAKETFRLHRAAAAEFVRIYGEELSPKIRKTALAVAEMGAQNKWQKINTIRKYNLQKNTPLRTLVQYFLI